MVENANSFLWSKKQFQTNGQNQTHPKKVQDASLRVARGKNKIIASYVEGITQATGTIEQLKEQLKIVLNQ